MEQAARVTRQSQVLNFDDDVFLFERHRKRLGDVGAFHQLLTGLDGDLELPRPGRLRIAPRLPGADVELPAVPRAAQEFPVAIEAIVAGPVGLNERPDTALAERAALMRAAVGEREIFPADIEHADLAAGDTDQLAPAGRHVARAGHHLTFHWLFIDASRQVVQRAR